MAAAAARGRAFFFFFFFFFAAAAAAAAAAAGSRRVAKDVVRGAVDRRPVEFLRPPKATASPASAQHPASYLSSQPQPSCVYLELCTAQDCSIPESLAVGLAVILEHRHSLARRRRGSARGPSCTAAQAACMRAQGMGSNSTRRWPSHQPAAPASRAGRSNVAQDRSGAGAELAGPADRSNGQSTSFQERLRPTEGPDLASRGSTGSRRSSDEQECAAGASLEEEGGGRKDVEDELEADEPWFVEEEDPTWPPEADEGWGFRVSQFFEPRLSSEPPPSTRPVEQGEQRRDAEMAKEEDHGDGLDEADEDDEEDKWGQMWNVEADEPIVADITSNDWDAEVFGDASPLVVCIFERYGPRREASWRMLEALERAAVTIWGSGKVPFRAFKVDAGIEPDMATSLGVERPPQLLFIKNSKYVHRVEEPVTVEELLQISGHILYGGPRPAHMQSS
eukprot:SM000147S01119  [mRNA]  locus=s147:261252:263817:+ [translate_table: standard]